MIKVTSRNVDKRFALLVRNVRQARHAYFRYSKEKRLAGEAICDPTFNNSDKQACNLIHDFEQSGYRFMLDGKPGIKRFYELFQQLVERENKGKNPFSRSEGEYLETSVCDQLNGAIKEGLEKDGPLATKRIGHTPRPQSVNYDSRSRREKSVLLHPRGERGFL